MPTSGGYVALPVRIGERAFYGTLFVRAHVSKEKDAALPPKRTLFVLNVPAGATEESLAAAFAAKAGEVTAVYLSSAHASSAHIVFAQPSALQKALVAGKKALEVAHGSAATEATEESSGEAAVLAAAGASTSGAAPSRSALHKAVGAFMERFEVEEAERIAAEEARHNSMDADGFVVVSRKRTGRGTATDAAGATVGVASAGAERHFANEAAAAADGEWSTVGGEEGGEGLSSSGGVRRKKKRAKETHDFYHFQQHEKKREGLLKLRAQFEADKERIAKMRADRKFKPQGY